MYKLTAWIKKNEDPERYILEAETISELWELLTIDVDLLDILELHISKQV